jgi:sortase A
MRRFLRLLGTLMIVAGLCTLAWAFAVWRWEDPFTSLYTSYEQRGLSSGLEERFATYKPAVAQAERLDPATLAAEARRYRAQTDIGDGIGRIEVPRLGVKMVLVYGTDHASLKRGPGLDPRTFFLGQRRLVYVAGHRTTYAAPFSKIDSLRRGDVIRVEMPYGTFTYRVTGSRIVAATDLSVLKSKRYEQIILQACHPRFFASHRYLAFAKPISVTPPGRAGPTTSRAAGAGSRR